MDDEAVITQIGLLLTQVHYARIALEGIERATTRYAGIALSMQGSSAGGSGTPWGAPPLFDGALKVYVVNLADLTSGSSLGDVIAGVLGGAGRFLGGFVGGIAGGAVGAVALPWMLHEAARITEHVDSILARLGAAPGGTGTAGGAGGSTLSDQLQSLTSLVREVTGLFTAAASGPGSGGPRTGAAAGADGGITAALQPALAVAIAATRLVDGLVLLLPMAVGSIALLLNSLGRIEVAVLDLVEFALRGALLLRAAVLGAALDAVSVLGRLAATTIGLVVTALDTIIPSVFRLLVTGLETALTALSIVSTGIKNLVDGLLLWLRDGLGSMLIFIGNLRVFRLLEHLAQVAPAVLAAVARLMDKPLSRTELRALERASRIILPSGSGASSVVPPVAPAPDLLALALPPAARTALVDSVRALGTSFATETHTSLTAVHGALGGIGTAFRHAADHLDDNLATEIGARSQIAAAEVRGLSRALEEARATARERPATGLEAIATAYEGWLSGGGLSRLFDQIQGHFASAPTSGATASTSLAGRTVQAVLADRSDRRVVVEIDEVVLELAPAAAAAAGPSAAGTAAFDADGYLAWRQEIADRGGLVPA